MKKGESIAQSTQLTWGSAGPLGHQDEWCVLSESGSSSRPATQWKEGRTLAYMHTYTQHTHALVSMHSYNVPLYCQVECVSCLH